MHGDHAGRAADILETAAFDGYVPDDRETIFVGLEIDRTRHVRACAILEGTAFDPDPVSIDNGDPVPIFPIKSVEDAILNPHPPVVTLDTGKAAGGEDEPITLKALEFDPLDPGIGDAAEIDEMPVLGKASFASSTLRASDR